jgi:hypothetical protein
MIASSQNRDDVNFKFAVTFRSIMFAMFLFGSSHAAQAQNVGDQFQLTGNFEQVGDCDCFEFGSTEVCSAPKFALNLLADSKSNQFRSSNARGAEEFLAADGSKQSVGHWLYPYPGRAFVSDRFRKRDTDHLEYRFSSAVAGELNVDVQNQTLVQAPLPIRLLFKPSRPGGEINGPERREFKQSKATLEYETFRRRREHSSASPNTKDFSSFLDALTIVQTAPDRVKLVASFDFTMDSFGYGPRFSFNYGYVACELRRH